ncbi:MAG: hypothetical protein WEA75_06715 [Acidimicrobiia bacterium]
MDDKNADGGEMSPAAIVIRFRPTNPESVLAWAQKEHRRTGYFRLSVFADVAGPGEDDDAVIQRLLDASELAGVDPGGNKKFYVCTNASELLGLGFTFHKDEEEGESSEHWSVDIGADPSGDDALRFLSPFGPPEGRRR